MYEFVVNALIASPKLSHPTGQSPNTHILLCFAVSLTAADK